MVDLGSYFFKMALRGWLDIGEQKTSLWGIKPGPGLVKYVSKCFNTTLALIIICLSNGSETCLLFCNHWLWQSSKIGIEESWHF